MRIVAKQVRKKLSVKNQENQKIERRLRDGECVASFTTARKRAAIERIWANTNQWWWKRIDSRISCRQWLPGAPIRSVWTWFRPWLHLDSHCDVWRLSRRWASARKASTRSSPSGARVWATRSSLTKQSPLTILVSSLVYRLLPLPPFAESNGASASWAPRLFAGDANGCCCSTRSRLDACVTMMRICVVAMATRWPWNHRTRHHSLSRFFGKWTMLIRCCCCCCCW